jgi:hypothetical protein
VQAKKPTPILLQPQAGLQPRSTIETGVLAVRDVVREIRAWVARRSVSGTLKMVAALGIVAIGFGAALGISQARAGSSQTTATAITNTTTVPSSTGGQETIGPSTGTTGTTATTGTSPQTTTATTPIVTTDITPTVTHEASGGTNYTYNTPDDETIETNVPPAGFDPLTASAAELAEYNFPARPTSQPQLQDWESAMSEYTSSVVPTSSLPVQTTLPVESTNFSRWAGFSSGKWNSHSSAFHGVSADVTVPSNNNCASENEPLAAWIGIGGTTLPKLNNLVQEGFVCGDDPVSGGGGGFRPFQEFADTNNPKPMCGVTGLYYAEGSKIWLSLGYTQSDHEATFFALDLKTQHAISCKIAAPLSRGWVYDGNTADYETEAPAAVLQPFSPAIGFDEAALQWWSTTGPWSKFGTRPTTKDYNDCMLPSKIGSDEESFSVSWRNPKDGLCGK